MPRVKVVVEAEGRETEVVEGDAFAFAVKTGDGEAKCGGAGSVFDMLSLAVALSATVHRNATDGGGSEERAGRERAS